MLHIVDYFVLPLIFKSLNVHFEMASYKPNIINTCPILQCKKTMLGRKVNHVGSGLSVLHGRMHILCMLSEK